MGDQPDTQYYGKWPNLTSAHPRKGNAPHYAVLAYRSAQAATPYGSGGGVTDDEKGRFKLLAVEKKLHGRTIQRRICFGTSAALV
jgi:hypothetical protein